MKAANSQMENLKKKVDAERSAEAEKQRIMKLQLEMERVKVAKDKEEQAKLEDEQIKKQYNYYLFIILITSNLFYFELCLNFAYRKIEIELRRKAEEEIHKNDIFLSQVSV